MIRKLIARFNRSITERAHAPRYKLEAPVSISIEPSIKIKKLSPSLENISIKGVTYDLSKSGIAFIVPSIRLKENYLVGEKRTLCAEIDLPNGKVKMSIVGHRYEQIVDENSPGVKYVIGASIVDISQDDKESYEYFLRNREKFKENQKAFNYTRFRFLLLTLLHLTGSLYQM
jgi:hypothetical protein